MHYYGSLYFDTYIASDSSGSGSGIWTDSDTCHVTYTTSKTKYSIFSGSFRKPITLKKDYQYTIKFGLKYAKSTTAGNNIFGSMELYDGDIQIPGLSYSYEGLSGSATPITIDFVADQNYSITKFMFSIGNSDSGSVSGTRVTDFELIPLSVVQRSPATVEAIEQQTADLQQTIDNQTSATVEATEQQTSAIGGFFSNLFSSISALILPSQEYFSSFFSEFNDWMEEHFGALYYPIALIVDILERLADLPVSDQPSITLPGITIQGQKLWDDTTYTFDFSDGLGLQNLYQLYLTVVDCIIAISLVNLAKHKMEQIEKGT